jgi:hypothetical protein
MSEITPEMVAAAVSEGDFGWIESLQAALSVTATGRVLNLEVARWDGPNDSEVTRHFRAVVVEGEGTVIIASPEFLAAARSLYRAHVIGASLPPEEYARVIYERQKALDALTPEQLAVLAGDNQDGGGDDA